MMDIKKMDLLDEKTGELIQVNNISYVNKFNSNFNVTPRADAEKNEGDYIVDDSDYLPLEVLIERTKRFSPREYNDIKSGKYMETVHLRPEELDKYYAETYPIEDEELTETNPEVAGVHEGEAGDVAPTQQAKSNPAEADPTATGNGAVESDK